jgi:STAS-like domain of unknown function (DUF4325)
MITVNVATDFSRHPAGRFTKDGPYSGEAFRKKFLEPNLAKGQHVVVDLAGARGYGSSFLEEAFGGLVRCGYAKDFVNRMLTLSASNSSLKQEINDYINKVPQDI